MILNLTTTELFPEDSKISKHGLDMLVATRMVIHLLIILYWATELP